MPTPNSDQVKLRVSSDAERAWGWAIRECVSSSDGSAMYAVFDTNFPHEVLFFLPADPEQLDGFKEALNALPV